MVKPWERYDGETPRSFLKFQIYRDMGPNRSLDKVVKFWNEKYGKMTRHNLESLSQKHKWFKRATAYDVYLEKITREVNEREIIEMQHRHSSEAKILQNRALQICFDPKMDTEKIELSKKAWILQTTAKAYKELALLERLSRGEVTEKVAKEDDGLKKLTEALDKSEAALREKKKTTYQERKKRGRIDLQYLKEENK